MADRNVWDPATPTGFINEIKGGLVVELYIYMLKQSAKTEDAVKADVQKAARIWCQSQINIQVADLRRLNDLPPSEPLNLNSRNLAQEFSCGQATDQMVDQIFNIQRPGNPDISQSIAVFCIPGDSFQDGSGCHRVRFPGGDGPAEHIILLADKADGRVLAHELGHALFTRRVGTQWINDDPDPERDSTKIHNKDRKNLMFPILSVEDPVITPPQTEQAEKCRLTHDRGLVFGFKEDKRLILAVIIKTLTVTTSSDEITSDDLLESAWNFRVRTEQPSGSVLVGSTKPWAMDPLHWTTYTIEFDYPILDISSNDDKLIISVTGVDYDFGPNDILPPINKVWTMNDAFWGSDSTDPSIPGGMKGDHTEHAQGPDIEYSIMYNVRVVSRPKEEVFRTLC